MVVDCREHSTKRGCGHWGLGCQPNVGEPSLGHTCPWSQEAKADPQSSVKIGDLLNYYCQRSKREHQGRDAGRTSKGGAQASQLSRRGAGKGKGR
jgi:hypothetical protein